jgi:ATP-dependent helicase YprA (DUF1998 family)
LSIFDLHQGIINDYREYVRSFVTIKDPLIKSYVDKQIMENNSLWPEALIQLNPSYDEAETVEELAHQNILSSVIPDIFRSDGGTPLRLFRHQSEAIKKAHSGRSFVVTSGTGSGKSPTYLISIIDAIVRNNPSQKRFALSSSTL